MRSCVTSSQSDTPISRPENPSSARGDSRTVGTGAGMDSLYRRTRYKSALEQTVPTGTDERGKFIATDEKAGGAASESNCTAPNPAGTCCYLATGAWRKRRANSGARASRPQASIRRVEGSEVETGSVATTVPPENSPEYFPLESEKLLKGELSIWEVPSKGAYAPPLTE